MKTNFKTKFVYYLGAILTVLIGICLVCYPFMPENMLSEGEGFLSLKNLLSIIFGAILVSFALNLMFIPGKIRKIGNETFLIQQTSNGVLRISKKAIEGIVLRCAGRQKDVSVLNIETSIVKDEVVIKTTVNVAENTAIPVAVDNLQKQIIAQLKNSAGISQSKVIVSVAEHTPSPSENVLDIPEDRFTPQITEENTEEEAIAAENIEEENSDADKAEE